MKGIGFARRKKVEAHAARLIAAEMTLHELKQARQIHAGTDGEGSGHRPRGRFPTGKA